MPSPIIPVQPKQPGIRAADWPTDEQLDNARLHERATIGNISRRFILKAGAGAAVGGMALGGVALSRGLTARDTIALAQDSGSGTATASGTSMCVLTPELTEGPYWLDDLLVRNDITEGKAGVPFHVPAVGSCGIASVPVVPVPLAS